MPEEPMTVFVSLVFPKDQKEERKGKRLACKHCWKTYGCTVGGLNWCDRCPYDFCICQEVAVAAFSSCQGAAACSRSEEKVDPPLQQLACLGCGRVYAYRNLVSGNIHYHGDGETCETASGKEVFGRCVTCNAKFLLGK